MTPRGCWEMSHDVWSCLKKRRLNNDGGSFVVTWLQTRRADPTVCAAQDWNILSSTNHPEHFVQVNIELKTWLCLMFVWWDEPPSETLTDAHKTRCSWNRKTCTGEVRLSNPCLPSYPKLTQLYLLKRLIIVHWHHDANRILREGPDAPGTNTNSAYIR